MAATSVHYNTSNCLLSLLGIFFPLFSTLFVPDNPTGALLLPLPFHGSQNERTVHYVQYCRVFFSNIKQIQSAEEVSTVDFIPIQLLKFVMFFLTHPSLKLGQASISFFSILFGDGSLRGKGGGNGRDSTKKKRRRERKKGVKVKLAKEEEGGHSFYDCSCSFLLSLFPVSIPLHPILSRIWYSDTVQE